MVFAPTSPLLPSTGNCILLLCCFALSGLVRSMYARVLFYTWCVWYILGVVSFQASLSADLGWASLNHPRLQPYATIYVQFLLSAIAGAVLAERLFEMRASPPSALAGRSPLELALLTLFPFVYIASVIATTGSLLLFSGGGTYDQLYSTDFGPLAPFRLIIVASTCHYILYFGLLSRKIWSPHLLVVVTFLLISLADGRRILALVTVASIMLLLLEMKGRRALTAILVLAGAGLGIYILVRQIRNGGGEIDPGPGGWAPMLTAVGEEFRDSIYAVTNFSRGQAATTGYDWPGSTLASVSNRLALSLFSLDKDELIQHDSARTFMTLFAQQFGIRLGIVTELWYAFGDFGMAAMATLGAAIAWSGHFAANARNILLKSFSVALFANLVLGITSQSTVIFGFVPTMVYAYAGLWVLSRLFGTRTAEARTPPQSARRRRPLISQMPWATGSAIESRP